MAAAVGAEAPLGHGGAAAEAAAPAPDDAVVFVGISLVLGIASRHLLRGTRVPYTVALLVLGVALGSLEYGTKHGIGKLGAGIRLWANINPNLLLAVFLPALLFESSFAMEVHQIKKCMVQMLLLAGPGVLISTFCLGAALKATFPYQWDWKTSLLLGGLLSATDPVAVVALLKELGASKKLSTIIEGESLMNDGTAIVVYQLFYQMVMGQSFNMGDIIKFLSQVTLGAVAVGLAFGIVSVLWLGFIFNDTVIEITLTLAVSYIAYFTAQDAAEVSGVLTVMTLGMFYAAAARTAFKGDSQESLHHFWEMVAYIANTLIFILSGVVIAEGVLNNDNHFERHGTSWGYLVLLYVYVQVSRIIVVAVLYPLLRYFGYGLDWKESIILVWAGLRGAVALALSLSVNRASDNPDQSYLKPEVGTLFVFFTGGVVFLTLIVNGSTTQWFLHLLGMDKLSAAKIRILSYTRHEMLNKALEAFGDLGDDEELGPSDWPTVKKYITCLNDLEEEQVHPHNVSESDHHLRNMTLTDIRIRLLNDFVTGVQAAYWGMLEEGRITQNTAIILMTSVDEAMDVVSTEPLCDWNGLRSNVHFPTYYTFLQMSRLPQRIITFFTVERLESQCYICAAFLRAHRIARRQLHDFIGDSQIASVVSVESYAEGEEARKFLENVRLAFPQVLRVVKTRQVTYSILKHLSEYVQNLQKVGLLEEKEMFHLDDAVQTDLKKLLRNPPPVKMPKASDLLSAHPMFGALPDEARDALKASMKETLKSNGATLYKEGSRPNGIWLISAGVVKWSSRRLSSKHSLHPVFSHGSTLGLFEVLARKPYICDVIADSVVQCFFIEAEKLQSLLKFVSAVEDFLWQECSLVIARLLLPKMFEEMAMHELRLFSAERSTMKNYGRGEVIELKQNSAAILLDGFVRIKEEQQNFIMPPAVLLPPHTDASFYGLESSALDNRDFCCVASQFEVEPRARVIIFDLGKYEVENALSQRWSMSKMVSPAVEPLRTRSREHTGLLSWPESFYKEIEHHQSTSRTDKQPTSFSARALQLSMYGSMVNDMYGAQRRDRRASRANHVHSFSYPRVPSKTRSSETLVCVQSEGSSMKRRMKSMNSAKFSLIPPLPVRRTEVAPAQENSSDDDDDLGGEEVIVRIDSPSRLNFNHASGHLFSPPEDQ
ncbi:Sodium/hydrogen exchanger 7 [Ananas comosus]|uniref:Sodium/hydrogen exchanger 7 n=1 Tax=Ananas comosus TaxID=4615 RepID=A0A199VLM6_ANACO|nr:Sodium/hydrogen exchanger 7 [Ananas comosus]